MFIRILILTLASISLGCTPENDEPESQVSDVTQLKESSLVELVDQLDNILFVDSHPGGIMGIKGEEDILAFCKLNFKKGGQVSFESGAYNFCEYHGSFQVDGDEISIAFDSGSHVFDIKGEASPIYFPKLIVNQSPQGIELFRKDGETHLREHWNVYEGTDIFPLILTPSGLRMIQAEQAGAGQPATRPESTSEGSDKPQPESEGRSR
jgi:hypothetical protein